MASDRLLERADAAVVHIGGRDGDIAQRRRLESAHVAHQSGHVEEPRVVRRVRAGTVDVIEPGIMEAHPFDVGVRVRRAVREIEPAVAMEALETLRKEQLHAANRGVDAVAEAIGDLLLLGIITH